MYIHTWSNFVFLFESYLNITFVRDAMALISLTPFRRLDPSSRLIGLKSIDFEKVAEIRKGSDGA
jgi:hypothetical protein